MTISEFNALSLSAQEEFINSGGIINNLAQPLEKSALSKEIQDVEPEFLSREDVSGHSTQSSDKWPGPKETVPQELTDSMAKDSTQRLPAVSESPANPSHEVFDIKDPVELLFLLDDTVSSGKVTLHKWQIQFLLDFAEGGKDDSHPFQSVVRACNGSGKDKYIIAPAAVWLCMRHKKARCIITSSSGVQLDNQTCEYIEQLCLSANRKFGPIWKCNYRYYECLATESPMVCYATDEPGKAEGFHPLEFGAKMAILVSEDKTVPDDINIAINKCTGYTHRCHVSTPGNAFGHFFDLCSSSIDRSSIKSVNEIRAEDYIQYHIKGANIESDKILPGDCPHLQISYVKQMARDLPGGISGAAFRSQVLAEFSASDEMVVIPYTYIWKCKSKPISTWIQETYNKAGLDLSDGGDETALIIRNGNRVLKLIPFRFDNTEDTVRFLIEKFRENSLQNPNSLIFADCGGIGKPILDRLKRLGWTNIRYCDNRHRSSRPKTYRNWAAESWFHFGELLKRNEILLIDDKNLTTQLSTRYYKIVDGAIHQLLSKVEMRSRGYPSPDRADACVLAFSDYKSTFVEQADKEVEKPFEDSSAKVKVKGDFSLKAWANGRSDKYKRYNRNNGQNDFSSLLEEIAECNRNIINKSI